MRTLIKISLIAFSLFTSYLHARAQNIYTVVGTGTPGNTGNGGLATAAEIRQANGITFDAAGNMYFCDPGFGVVRRVDIITGDISVVAGTGTPGASTDGVPATSSQLWFPDGVAIDGVGNLYICDGGNEKVFKVNTSGIISTIAGTGTLGYNGDGIPATTATLKGPIAVAIDAYANVYVSDQANGRVRRIDANTGIITTIAGTGDVLYSTLNGDGAAATLAKLGEIKGLTVDASGNVYFTDDWQGVVRQVNTSGIINTVAGNGTSGNTGNGGLAVSAELNRPSDIVIDLAGNLYITDYATSSSVVRRVDAVTGIISLFAGSNTAGFGGDHGPATAALLNDNESLGIDCAGNIYIGDNLNHRIRLVCTMEAPVITTTATVICPNTPVTFTVSDAATPGCVAYYWFKTVSGSTSYITTGMTYTDNNPTDGEQVYCAVIPNAFNSLCGTTPLASNTITISVAIQLVDVDINTLCLPGSSTPPVTPQITTTTSGGGLLMPSYLWIAQPGNQMLLSSTTSANPTVTGPSVSGGTLLSYKLIVSDGVSSCPSQSRIVNFQFNSDATFDLAMRDSHLDMYEEPNTQGGVFWESQDLWNRIIADGLTENQAPEYMPATPNYMYAEVRNVGCITSPSPTATPNAVLKLYWTIGGTAEVWSADWTTATITGVGSVTLPKGQQIATLTIPALDPGQKVQMNTSWTPPNPSAYYTDATTVAACFLARIVDEHDPANTDGMTIQEVANVGLNITNNNNIVTTNSVVLKISHRYPQVNHILVGNVGTVDANFNLKFVNQVNYGGGISVLNQYMYVTIALGSLFDRWVASGAVGTYASIDYDAQTVTFDGTNTMVLTGVPLSAGECDDVTLSFYMISGADGTQMPNEEIHFMQTYMDGDIEQLSGGYSFTMAYDPDETGGRPGRGVTALHNTANAISSLADMYIYPNPVQQNLNIDFSLATAGRVSFIITDLLGREISSINTDLPQGHQTQEIATGKMMPGMYILTVRTETASRQFKFTKE